jgi:hypothetical protein
MLTRVSLVDGSREMLLLPRQDDGIFVQEIDAPMPEVREVAENRTDDDGTRDTTSLFGARACSMELLVTESPRAVEDELSRYLHPRVRPYLVVEDDGWSQARRLMLRTDTFDAPLTLDTARVDARRISAGWKVPTGIWEAAETSEQTVLADSEVTEGRTYPKTYPWQYAATLSAGASLITNLGSVPSHFTARLYGPCSGPRLTNETTGEQITFTTALTLGAGEYVEIDTRERTAYMLSSVSASRLTYLDFEETSWWRIEPGENKVRYAPRASTAAGSAAVITYRAAWL